MPLVRKQEMSNDTYAPMAPKVGNDFKEKVYRSLADPGGGGAPGRGPMILLCPKRIFFLKFFSLSTLAIIFKHSFKRNMAKTR